MTDQEYLECKRLAETKSEFYAGEMFAMARSNFWHSLIVTNLLGELAVNLRRRPYIGMFFKPASRSQCDPVLHLSRLNGHLW
jgi:Uma2 family endonuclease